GFFRIAATGRDDLAARQEGARDRNRLVEQPTRIVAQIHDVACELVLRNLLLDIGDGLMQAVSGLLVERGDPDVADIATVGVVAHRLYLDDLPRKRHVERILALADDL